MRIRKVIFPLKTKKQYTQVETEARERSIINPSTIDPFVASEVRQEHWIINEEYNSGNQNIFTMLASIALREVPSKKIK